MMDWIHDHEALLWWAAVISAVLFVGTLLALPFLVALIPDDYFVHKKRRPQRKSSRRPFLRGLIVVFKNLLGLVLILAGIVMLVVPGQGLVTIFIGFVLTNFPGKYAVERWIIRRSAVRRAVNWLRARAHRPPLQSPEPDDASPNS